jgi:hypothetical protein
MERAEDRVDGLGLSFPSDEGSDREMSKEVLARAQAAEPLPEGEEPNHED